MAGFVSKQPNGLYCRFSSVTDCPTAWNMTREDYINMKMQEAKEDAEDVLDNYLKPFDMVVDMYYPNNMTKEEFDKFKEWLDSDRSKRVTFVEVPKTFKDQVESDKVFLIPTNDEAIKPIRVIFEGE